MQPYVTTTGSTPFDHLSEAATAAVVKSLGVHTTKEEAPMTTPRNIKRYRAEQPASLDGAWTVRDMIMREMLRDPLDREQATAYADNWNARPWLRPAASAWRPQFEPITQVEEADRDGKGRWTDEDLAAWTVAKHDRNRAHDAGLPLTAEHHDRIMREIEKRYGLETLTASEEHRAGTENLSGAELEWQEERRSIRAPYRVQVYRSPYGWKTKRNAGTLATLDRAAAMIDGLTEDGELCRVIDCAGEQVGPAFTSGTIGAVRAVGRFLRGGPTASDRIREAREARGDADPLNRLQAHTARLVAEGQEPITEIRAADDDTAGTDDHNRRAPIRAADVPSGCTGYVDMLRPQDGIQHDGPTCPIHEDASPAGSVEEETAQAAVEAADRRDALREEIRDSRHAEQRPDTIARAIRTALGSSGYELQGGIEDDHNGPLEGTIEYPGRCVAFTLGDNGHTTRTWRVTVEETTLEDADLDGVG